MGKFIEAAQPLLSLDAAIGRSAFAALIVGDRARTVPMESAESDSGDALRPCPFCGAVAEPYQDAAGYGANCNYDDGCGCEIGGHLSEQAARAAWNQRTADAVIAQLEARLREMEAQNEKLRLQLLK